MGNDTAILIKALIRGFKFLVKLLEAVMKGETI